MKVILHYEDNENTELWKTLKITLPKSWKNGPASKLLDQFVESYNASMTFNDDNSNPLDVNCKDQLYLAIRKPISLSATDDTSSAMVQLGSDATIVDYIPDRADIYIMHGPSKTLDTIKQEEAIIKQQTANPISADTASTTTKNLVSCTRFGCQRRFPKGGPYPTTPCIYHKSPPVFHETAKFWSCCPTKKAYDWDSFQSIKGCCESPICTEIKDDTEKQPLFLGGSDLREKAGDAVKLKSIDDFNKSQAAGGSDVAPILERLQVVLTELGIDKELYDQVIDGYTKQFQSQVSNDVELLAAIKKEIGDTIKASLKAVVVEQLRIK